MSICMSATQPSLQLPFLPSQGVCPGSSGRRTAAPDGLPPPSLQPTLGGRLHHPERGPPCPESVPLGSGQHRAVQPGPEGKGLCGVISGGVVRAMQTPTWSLNSRSNLGKLREHALALFLLFNLPHFTYFFSKCSTLVPPQC